VRRTFAGKGKLQGGWAGQASHGGSELHGEILTRQNLNDSYYHSTFVVLDQSPAMHRTLLIKSTVWMLTI
jgi:hypothetical protein